MGNREAQAAFKARMRDRGLIQVNEWIPASEREAIRQFAKALRERHSGTEAEAITSNDMVTGNDCVTSYKARLVKREGPEFIEIKGLKVEKKEGFTFGIASPGSNESKPERKLEQEESSERAREAAAHRARLQLAIKEDAKRKEKQKNNNLPNLIANQPPQTMPFDGEIIEDYQDYSEDIEHIMSLQIDAKRKIQMMNNVLKSGVKDMFEKRRIAKLAPSSPYLRNGFYSEYYDKENHGKDEQSIDNDGSHEPGKGG